MPKNNNKEFKFSIKDDFDFIIEEGNNTSINLRKIAWGDSTNFKLDLRKWVYQDGEERAYKGVTLTEEGGDELANVLVSQGYGDTQKILSDLKKREDFDKPNNIIKMNTDESEDEEYYDPKELLDSIAEGV